MDQYCMYLRKSRVDDQNGCTDTKEVLARHERILLDLAKRLNITISKTYREVKSGETIAARPVMQHLLSEVEEGLWKGVLTVEVERLARGDTIDQGIVAQAFKYSNTLIITPVKIYDPNNEFDEEYFEFGLFMSRREYKVINRRLQNGRLAAVKEGKYVANRPPYGYARKKLDRTGWTLEPIPEQAAVVQMIYNWYVGNGCERMGCGIIANKLNALHIKSPGGNVWVIGSIRDILINPVYNGKIRWNWRPGKKAIKNNTITVERPRSHDYLLVNGLHEAIIRDDIWNQAQKLMSSNPPRPVNEKHTVKNPLSGLIVCGMCGRKMIRRPNKKNPDMDMLICCHVCDNVGSQLSLVESHILGALSEWAKNYTVSWQNIAEPPKPSNYDEAFNRIEKELSDLETQLNKIFNLFETGVYDLETFTQRKSAVQAGIAKLKLDRNTIMQAKKEESLHNQIGTALIPKIKNVLDIYHTLENAAAKNDLLKEVLEKVEYTRKEGGRWHPDKNNFEIVIYPKLPKG